MKKAIILTLTISSLLAAFSLHGQTVAELFTQKCGICHTIDVGKLIGPDLSGVPDRRSEKWLIDFIQSSQTKIYVKFISLGDNIRNNGDLRETIKQGETKILNCLTPHGKWHIHSTYMENLCMLTLSRDIEPFWIYGEDVKELGINDNDWVEVYNNHGVYCTRAVIPRGVCIVYHVPERTVGIPKSQVRGNRRGVEHNSFTRIHLKPNFLVGGYGQFSYHFNYWGPIAPNRDTHVIVKKMEKLVW